MSRSFVPAIGSTPSSRALGLARQAGIVVGASLFIALCAHLTLPLAPVPLTLQNFAVLVVGLTLGSRRGFAALMLYLLEGASGLPVFSPTGMGGIAQLLGPTGGFLMSYPFVAALAGWIFEHGQRTFARAAVAALAGEIVLFAAGIGWLTLLTHSFLYALRAGFYLFVFAEVMKIMFAAAVAARLRRNPRTRV